jgi:site-specific DNA-methyltransferase (adenine-specific)
MTVETVGFEIRDQIMWIYGSGFPKSQDVGRQIQKSLGIKEKKTIQGGARPSDKMNTPYADEKEYETTVCTDTLAKQWSGWGTQLKPAHEPIVMARKPVIGSIRENVLEHGTGAINIDATRVTYGDNENISTAPRKAGIGIKKFSKGDEYGVETTNDELKADGFITQASELGRFPANVIHDGSDEVVSLFPHSKSGSGAFKATDYEHNPDTPVPFARGDYVGRGDDGSAARFFYCPKVSQKERNIGCDSIEPKQQEAANFRPNHKEKADAGESGSPYGRFNPVSNNHPTVKPIELMKYLIKLVTPPNGHILDPFNGSGSTGCAAVELGFDYTGIELDPNYVEIATKRISHWEQECKPKTTYDQLFEETK